MSNAKGYDDLAHAESAPELEQLRLLLEKAEDIYKDLGNLLTAMDKMYIERKTKGQPPQRDFLERTKANGG